MNSLLKVFRVWFSGGVHHETREKRAALPSPAFSHARGHFRVSRVCSTDKEKRDTARSLSLLLVFEVFFINDVTGQK